MIEPGVVRIADGADQVPILASEKIRGVVRLERSQAEVQPRGTEDLGIPNPTALEPQQRGVPFRAHLFDLEALVERVRR